jgi:putative ABC transport system permease protein
MTSAATTAEQVGARPRLSLPLSLRLALRELRGGISGFYIFVICIALGAMAIAAVGTLSASIERAISREGRVLLGGDVEARRVHRQATPQERRLLEAQGTVSEVATLRSMARLADGAGQALVQVKAVDRAYPLYGAAEFEDGKSLADIRQPGAAAVERALIEQLGLKTGDRFQLGNETLTVAAVLSKEPDRLTAGLTLGPRVLVSLETLNRTGLAQPGSLINWRYRVRDEAAGPQLTEKLTAELAGEGFRVRDRTDPSPGVSRSLRRLSDFLTLVGLTALLTGGIGVANSVSAFIERKRKVIAAYKALGAPGSLITRSFLIQVLIFALLGIGIGLLVGTALPFLATGLYGAILPIQLEFGFYPKPLLLATAYGLLIALIFILWPLGRARQIRAGELMREPVEGNSRRWPPPAFAAGSAVSAIVLTLMAIFLSQQPHIAAIAIAAVAVTFLIFAALGYGFQRLAGALPRPGRPEIALALSSIAGPAGLTRTVTVSLGAGLTLLTAIALTNASMTDELKTQIPDQAPSHFFVGINKNDFTRFSELIAAKAPGSQLNSAPMLRGQIVELAGTPASEVKPPQEAAWVLNGDRGLTFSERLPDDSQIVEGEWWPEGYSGEPLVSFEAETGKALGLKIGDKVTFNVLGRNVTAKLANFRTVEWTSLNINFVMIFSPNTLEAAPYGVLATLTWPQSDPAGEAEIVRAVAAQFPTVTAVRVRDALETVNSLLGKVFVAIRVAGSLTLLSGVLVLAGALSTARARRIYEAVILKTLGATRRRILLAHMAEHLILGLATAIVAALAGTVVAYILLTQIIEISFTAPAGALLQAAILATIFMVAFGFFGTLRVLNAKAAPYLRAE